MQWITAFHRNPILKASPPNNPCDYEDIVKWLNRQNLSVQSQSGIRVFSDYAREKRGGLASEDAVLEMELKYSIQKPYWHIGRYLHIVAKKS